MKQIEVVAAIIHDEEGRVFATQRGYGEWKDYWEFPGGKIESGESPEEALQREILEELNTQIVIEHLIDTVEWDYPAFHLTMHCYWCRVKSGHLELKEHEAAKWLQQGELESVDWLPADHVLISKLLKGTDRMDDKKDPMGRAVADYFNHKKTSRLRVFSPMFEEDEIPLTTLFRSYEDMPEIERMALDMSEGRVLDVGAAAGCHSLVLQERGLDVTAIDISPLSVDTMRQRGIRKVLEQDFFTVTEEYDTILMLMNGIGIVGTLDRMPAFFRLLNKILAPGGQLLCDSSDIGYVFEDDMPDMAYYGEQHFQMQYKDTIGEPFPWLYIDANLLKKVAAENGYHAEIVAEGPHYDYLARITKSI